MLLYFCHCRRGRLPVAFLWILSKKLDPAIAAFHPYLQTCRKRLDFSGSIKQDGEYQPRFRQIKWGGFVCIVSCDEEIFHSVDSWGKQKRNFCEQFGGSFSKAWFWGAVLAFWSGELLYRAMLTLDEHQPLHNLVMAFIWRLSLPKGVLDRKLWTAIKTNSHSCILLQSHVSDHETRRCDAFHTSHVGNPEERITPDQWGGIKSLE